MVVKKGDGTHQLIIGRFKFFRTLCVRLLYLIALEGPNCVGAALRHDKKMLTIAGIGKTGRTPAQCIVPLEANSPWPRKFCIYMMDLVLVGPFCTTFPDAFA